VHAGSIVMTNAVVLHNYAEVAFWFAVFYRNADWAFDAQTSTLNSFFESFNLSFVSLTTFGQTIVEPTGALGEALLLLEALVGLFMALIVIARFLSFIPAPKTMEPWEK
jgi:Ion channel